MRRVLITALLYLLPALALAQKHQELSFHIRSGILLNKKDVKSTLGNRTIMDLRNTFTLSAGGNYSKNMKHNLWLAAGVDIGYEHYQADIVYPFEEYGYIKDPVLSAHYTENAYIPFTDVSLTLAYRKTLKKIQPEVRIGQIFHLPLTQKVINTYSIARPVDGHRGNNFVLNGWYGQKPGSAPVELISLAYIGAGIPSKMKNVSRINLGLQLQSQLFGDHRQNYLSGVYKDGQSVKRSADVFKGTHTSASIVVGLVL